MDYVKLYNEVNQISVRMERMDFSENMVVHRMLVRLNDLDVTASGWTQTGLLTGAEKVKNLYIFADVVELPTASRRIRLPGTDRIVILCRTFVRNAESNSTDVPFPGGIRFSLDSGNRLTSGVAGVSATLASSTAATAGLQVRIQNGDYWTTMRNRGVNASSAPTLTLNVNTATGVVNMRTFTTFPTGSILFLGLTSQATIPRSTVDIVTDPNILTGVEVTLLIAELVKVAAFDEVDLTEAMTNHVRWINSLLRNAVNRLGANAAGEATALLCRAQGILKLKKPVVTVPRLQYDSYRNLINRMVQASERYDQSFQNLRLHLTLNQALGNFLLEQNQALAAREADMENVYAEIIGMRTRELNDATARLELLGTQMEAASAEMEEARIAMEAGLEEYRNRELARAFFSVVIAIGAVALTFATGGAAAPVAVNAAQSAVTTAGASARGLQRVIDILEKLQEVMEVVSAIRELADAMANIGHLVDTPEMPDMPSNADWDIFVNEVELVAEQMPTEVSEVPVWKAKARNVASLGREMSTTTAYIGQLQFEIAVEQLRMEVAQRQRQRLSSLTITGLDNYMQMVSEMDMRTTRMLLQLLNVLNIQNGALYYEYLMPPELLRGAWPLTMSSLNNVLIQQEVMAVAELTNLNPPIDLEVSVTLRDVPVSLLEDGDDWVFDLPVRDRDPLDDVFFRVRIRYVEVRFPQSAPHVPVTGTGQLYVLLQSGRELEDRGKAAAEFLSYEATNGVAYQYAYRLSDGQTTLSNIPSVEFANTYMRMTPFTTWRLRLSKSARENEGLRFPTAASQNGATTELQIRFFISTIRRISVRDQAGEEAALAAEEEEIDAAAATAKATLTTASHAAAVVDAQA